MNSVEDVCKKYNINVNEVEGFIQSIELTKDMSMSIDSKLLDAYSELIKASSFV